MAIDVIGGEQAPVAELRLFDYQQRAVDQLREAMQQGKNRVVLCIPTGGGKTECAAQIVREAIAKGKRILCLVERKTLAVQLYERLTRYIDSKHIGIAQGENTLNQFAQCLVATIQTLSNRDHLRADWDLVIVDEAHLMYEEATKIVANAPFAIGLTATPRAEMGIAYNGMITPVDITELIAIGQLVPVRAFCPSTMSYDNVKMLVGDFSAKDMGDAAMALHGDIVHHWRELASDRPTVVFAATVAAAEDLLAMMLDEGIRAEMVIAKTETDERSDITERLISGETQVVINVGVLTAGWDCPEVSCVVFARGTASEALFMQMIGRGLRAAEGKSDLLVLDHAGNMIRHGFPEEYRAPQLSFKLTKKREKAEKSSEEQLAAVCPACSAAMHPGQMKCENCGYERKRRPVIKVVEDRLVEVVIDEKARARRQREQAKEDAKRLRVIERDLMRQHRFNELLGVCEVKGWREGYARHLYYGLFKRYPEEDGVYDNGKACIPTEATMKRVNNAEFFRRRRRGKRRESA